MAARQRCSCPLPLTSSARLLCLPCVPHSNRAYLLVLTPEAAELYATRKADFARDDHGEGEVEGSGGSEGTLAAMRAAVMDPLQVRLLWVGGTCDARHARNACCMPWLHGFSMPGNRFYSVAGVPPLPSLALGLLHLLLLRVCFSLPHNTLLRQLHHPCRTRCRSLCSRACSWGPGP